MINLHEAQELTRNAIIPFPGDWKEQMLESAETSIKHAATVGKHTVQIIGRVAARRGGYGGEFQVGPEQLSEITVVLKQQGFTVYENLRIKHDGTPLTIDVCW